jgi:hypothetical protein
LEAPRREVQLGLITQKESGRTIIGFGGLMLCEPAAKRFVLALVIEASLPALP